MYEYSIVNSSRKGYTDAYGYTKTILHINNKPVILYTMEAFQIHPQIDAIIVVTLDAWKDMIWAYAKQYHIDKLKWIVTGGDSGQDSIQLGLKNWRENAV